MKKIIAAIMAVLLTFSVFGSTAAAMADAAPIPADTEQEQPSGDITVPLGTVSADADSAIEYPVRYGEKDSVLKWEGQTGRATFEVDVPEAGEYYLQLTYMPILSLNRGIKLSLQIDGAYAYDNAGTVEFPCIYKNEERRTDNKGNDMVPNSVKQEAWNKVCFTDMEGLNNGPLAFRFERGKHTVTLIGEMAAFCISDISLIAPKPLIGYREYLENQKQNNAGKGEEIILQGEDAVYKSASSIIPANDRASVATVPSSAAAEKLNTITFSVVGQWLEWNFDVKEPGMYKLGFRFRQNSLRGFSVTRKIYVDGEIPFAEFANAAFPYSGDWQYADLGDPYLLYLDKGSHSLRMEVVLGDFSEIIKDLSDVSKRMNELYRKIIMITSTSPDTYRDYHLEKQLDGFSQTLFDLSKKLNECAGRLDEVAGKKGGESAFLYEIADQLDDIGKNPETMASRLDRYSSNISSLSSWINDKKKQPLTIDWLRLSSEEQKAPKPEAPFFSQLWYRLKSVIFSYTRDYSSVGNVYEGGSSTPLEVWMTGGADYAKVAKNAIDDLFAPATGINVNLRLVQVSIIIATFAGKGPDVSMNIDSTTIINLAARGELVPLSEKSGFDDAVKNLYPESLVPYMHLGKCYGIPVTQSFSMMFYRTDIFKELNMAPPQTWQEFKEVVALLQSKNMQAGIGDLFTTLLMQQGMEVYNEDLSATNFDKAEAVAAFEEAMRYFTHIGLPDAFDFYNRFRSGEMPLALQDIGQYNMLSAAAPEINGLWEMVPIPGTPAEDGSIVRTQPIGGTSAAVMFNRAKDNDDAWTFLKWWTSAEAQARYGNDIEMRLGTAARYSPANVEAVKNLPWSNKELKNIFAQWDSVKGIPTLPASYYLNRGLTNAFRNVFYDHENPREALFYQNKQINKEIARKRKELQID